jgi:hypothetical protein
MDEFLHGVLFAAAIEALLALGFVLAARAKSRRSTGTPRFVRRGSRGYRNLVVALCLSLLVLVLVARAPHLALLLALLGGAAGSLWLVPRQADELYGSTGVQRGWRSRRFEELEEWRLTGDHLRFRIERTWLAVGLPAGEHAAARALLEERCPGRESRFSC